MNTPSAWVKEIFAITLFAENLAACKDFYQTVFGLSVVYEDNNSVVFKIGNTLINLLKSSEAEELLTPAKLAPPAAGARAVYTLHVEDVDATCAELIKRGVRLINGPMDRPWGIRTASFADPAGTFGKLLNNLLFIN